jgi:hypothetical protein
MHFQSAVRAVLLSADRRLISLHCGTDFGLKCIAIHVTVVHSRVSQSSMLPLEPIHLWTHYDIA